jgi:hypothetical protein
VQQKQGMKGGGSGYIKDEGLREEGGGEGVQKRRGMEPTMIYLIDSRMLTFSVFSLVRVTRSTRATVIQNTEA